MTALTIPADAAAITPRWLEAALRERAVPGVPDERGAETKAAEVAAVDVVDAHSGTTGRARLRVRWAPGSGRPDSALFAKLPPSDPVQRDWVVSVGMGEREVRFYRELAAGLPVRVPEPRWTGASEDGAHYLMLLEDLIAAGCTLYGLGSQGHDVAAHANAMMSTLGTLHGAFSDSPRFQGDLRWVAPPRRDPVGPELVGQALRLLGDEMPRAFRELGELYIHHTQALSDRLDSGTPTLAHGDCHIGNTFHDGDQVGLLDWALVCRAPGLRDVAYYLCNSLPIEYRRDQTEALLTRYLEALAAAGGQPPAFATALCEVQEHAVTSWVATAVTAAVGDRMQSVEAGRISLQRATAAIVDFDTAGRLRAALGQ